MRSNQASSAEMTRPAGCFRERREAAQVGEQQRLLDDPPTPRCMDEPARRAALRRPR